MKYIQTTVVPDEAYNYFLATLSNRNRIKMLNQLMDGPKNVSQLTDAIGVDQSTVSNHLARLRLCGFVSVKPNGQERVYHINKETTEPLMKLINLHTTKYCINCIQRKKKGGQK